MFRSGNYIKSQKSYKSNLIRENRFSFHISALYSLKFNGIYPVKPDSLKPLWTALCSHFQTFGKNCPILLWNISRKYPDKLLVVKDHILSNVPTVSHQLFPLFLFIANLRSITSRKWSNVRNFRLLCYRLLAWNCIFLLTLSGPENYVLLILHLVYFVLRRKCTVPAYVFVTAIEAPSLTIFFLSMSSSIFPILISSFCPQRTIQKFYQPL